jgi:hypothetical protein
VAYSLTWLPEILEAAGLKVAEVPGWRTRGRGEMGRVRGVMCHHTVGGARGNMPSLDTLIKGRTGPKAVPGPLAQLGLGRDGTYYVVAAGRANHAGAAEWGGLKTGNSSFIGIEAENTGAAGAVWPDVQMDAYHRGAAAILKHVGAPVSMCVGHKEYAPHRKPVDPRFDMDVFRRRVGEIMAGTAAISLIPAIDSANRPTVRRGDRGDAVRVLQEELGASEVDGIFGPRTEALVRQFQRDRGLVPDGIVGPKTWAAMTP